MTGATIRRPVTIAGTGLHTGCPTSVTLRATHEPGIIFRRTDLPGAPSVPASRSSVEGIRRTDLRYGATSVATVEHLMAACWGLGVTSLIVDVRGAELPAGDGSALLWTDALNEAGLVPVRAGPPAALHRAVTVTSGAGRLTLAPAPVRSVHFAGHFPDGKRHTVRWTPKTDFIRELAPARTFCRLSEVVSLRRAGLIRGGNPHNALVWVNVPITDELCAEVRRWWPDVRLVETRQGLLEPQRLRFPDEAARHKLVDLLGDLALAPSLPPCRVEATGSGHALAHELIRVLRAGGASVPG